MAAVNFSKKVYDLCSKVPRGKVTTYKELAHALNTRAYQAIGNALRNNPYAPKVPCHRVIKSDGSIGGFKGQTKGLEIQEKIDLLKKEGITIKNNKINLRKFLYTYELIDS